MHPSKLFITTRSCLSQALSKESLYFKALHRPEGESAKPQLIQRISWKLISGKLCHLYVTCGLWNSETVTGIASVYLRWCGIRLIIGQWDSSILTLISQCTNFHQWCTRTKLEMFLYRGMAWLYSSTIKAKENILVWNPSLSKVCWGICRSPGTVLGSTLIRNYLKVTALLPLPPSSRGNDLQKHLQQILTFTSPV